MQINLQNLNLHSLKKYKMTEIVQTDLKELNEKSDLSVSVDTVKKGRKVVALHFRFTEDKQIKISC